MNAASPSRGSRKTSGWRPSEGSSDPGPQWTDVDRLLDVRRRIGFALEELDLDAPDRAAFYLLGLLADLDNTAALVPPVAA